MLGVRVTLFVLASAITLVIAVRAHAQDAATGEKVFKNNCGICHSPQPGRNLIGPSLFSVVDRHSGQMPGFHYSDANLNSGLTWNVTTLDRYIAGPRELVPGTKMTFPGLKDAKQRADLIAYLATLR
ncbi:MAG TPA: cytochrome c family protein [Acetobacteraceae bacterium]|nr:cytochrome c family protein [Acetobacteraceae bacterium]